METVTLSLDQEQVTVPDGLSLLQLAWKQGKYIPSLCAHPDLSPEGSCRLCLVEVEGQPGLVQACDVKVQAGMVVRTESPAIAAARQDNLAKILANHPHVCLTCPQREGCTRTTCSYGIPVEERCCSIFNDCEIRRASDYVGIKNDTPRYVHRKLPIVHDEPFYNLDFNLCISCGRCVRVCRDVRGIGALGVRELDGHVYMGPIADTLEESGCKFCGSCVEVCPSGSLLDKVAEVPGKVETSLVPCREACPAGIDVPRYVRLIADGKFPEAVAVIREKVPFPEVLGYICFHPCEPVCRRGKIDEPISICSLKRFASSRDTGLWKEKANFAPATGKKVGVIGSGPAGLTTAYYLARKGHSVTVFEAYSEPGGMLRTGIPEYRLPREVLDREIQEIVDAGVKIQYNSRVDDLDALFAEGFEALFLAIGAHQGSKLGLKGQDSPRVMDGVSFLRRVNLGEDVSVGQKVAVIGGGNAAIDAARTARRLGSQEVTLIYRRTRAEMPAFPHEVDEAIHEGITLEFLTNPVSIQPGNGNLQVEFVRMELGDPDESGRRRPVPLPGSEYTREFDTVIAAIGQRPEVPDHFHLPLGKGDILEIHRDTLKTNREKVFAGGDAVSGPASVIEAISMGRTAASVIDCSLGGDGIIDESLVDFEDASPFLGKEEDFLARLRAEMPTLAVAERLIGFPVVELGLEEKAAIAEANRCLRCDLRLDLASLPLPPAHWLEFTAEQVAQVSEAEGVFELLDEEKNVLMICGTPNLRQSLTEKLQENSQARYFTFEEEPMYTQRESELLQQYLQQHGQMPGGGASDLDDLF